MIVVVAVALAVASADPAPCGTPRQAAATILGNLAPPPGRTTAAPGPEDLRRAARCVEVPPGMDRATLLARLVTLKDTLDSVGVVVRPADIPDDAGYLDARSFRPVFVLAPAAPLIRLERDDHGEWKLPADVVARAEDIHDDVVGVDLARFTRDLPPTWHRHFFGVEAWQWLGLVVVIVLAVVLRLVLGWLLTRRLGVIARGAAWRLSFVDMRMAARPLGWLIACGVVGLLVPTLGLPAVWTASLLAILRVFAEVCVVWLASRGVDLVATHLQRRAQETPSRMDDHLIPLARRIAKVIVVVLGVVVLLQGFGIDVGSLVAGLGIGGLAVALAAKDTIGNFFGSVAIFLDRPFLVGDWITANNGSVEGTVEAVGFRSTQIRTIRDTVVSLPNARMADAEVDNWGARRHRRLRLVVGFTRDASAAQLQAFTDALSRHLERQPHVKRGDIDVYVHDLTDTSVDILVHCYVSASTWSAELGHRHALILDVLRLTNELGLRLATPTRTVHVESQAAPRELPTVTPPSPAQLAAAVARFTAEPAAAPAPPASEPPQDAG